MIPGRDAPIGLAEAQALVESGVRVLPVEQVALADALGRVLRCDAVSDVDLPPSDMSAMDGFCLDSASTRGAGASRPARLRVSGTIRAGEAAPARVGPGECMAIMTGAALPAGADAVVSTEEVSGGSGAGGRDGSPDFISVGAEVEPGRWVRKRAEILARGDRVSLRGRRATPQVLGLLASLGVDPVPVTRRPIVGVLATGDELVALTEVPGPAALRASNLTMLLGQARALGCDVVDGGISGDDEASIAAGLERCRGCDAVVVTGGASGGKFDLVGKVLMDLGVQPAFREVRMGPGKRTAFGTRAGVAFFSLPGTPAAALIVFHMLVKPGLLAMMGASCCKGRFVKARIASALGGVGRRGWPPGIGGGRPLGSGAAGQSLGFTRIVAARWAGGRQGGEGGGEEGGPGSGRGGCSEGGPGGGTGGIVEPLAARGGGNVVSLSGATCFIILDEGTASVRAGDEVNVLPLDEDLSGSAAG